LSKSIKDKALQPKTRLFIRPLAVDEVSKEISLRMIAFSSFFLLSWGCLF